MTIDWQEFEEALYQFTRSQLEAFGKEHPDESFYAFAFCCNAYYGEIMLSLNSEADFRRKTTQNIGYVGYSKTELEELRWSIGDWQFMENTLSPSGESPDRLSAAVESFLAKIESLQEQAGEAYEEGSDDESAHEEIGALEREFLRRVCHIAVRLEKNGAFHAIRTDPDFTIYVADHDETDFESWRRLIRARIEFAPPWEENVWPIAGWHPQMATAIFAESAAYHQEGKLREAAHLAREAIARLPELNGEPKYLVEETGVRLPIPANNAFARAYAATAEGNWYEHELYHKALDEAERLDAGLAEIYYLRGTACRLPAELKHLDRNAEILYEVRQLDRAIDLDPGDARYYGKRAEKHHRQLHAYEEALRDYSKAHELDPTEEKWLMGRAETHVQLNDYAAAIDDYTKVHALWNFETYWTVRDALNGRAECNLQLKNYQAAIDDWTRLIDYDKKGNNVKQYLLKRAACHRALGNESAAVDDEARAEEMK